MRKFLDALYDGAGYLAGLCILAIFVLMIGASVAITLTHKLNYRRFRKVHIGGTYVGAALSWFHVIATSAEAKMLGLFGVTLAAIALVPIVLGLLRLLPAARADRARLALQPVNA